MVDKDRVDGSAKNIGGKLKEGVGNVTGDSKMQTEGKADQAEGKIQNTIGGIKDSIKDAFKKDWGTGYVAIASAVISLGRSLNLQTTAQGVETPGQVQQLQEMGYEFA